MNQIPIPQAHVREEFTSHEMENLSAISAYHFLNALIVPRPIAFVTSLGAEGVVNAAPFSYFNGVSSNPPIVSIAVSRREGKRKDTAQNIVTSKEFVVNVCSIDIAKAVNVAAHDFPSHTSEIEETGLSLLPSQKISVPRVANTLAQMECILYKVIEVGNDPVDLILGEVVMIHVHKDLMDKGRIDIKKLDPLARLAGISYAKLGEFFEMPRG